MRKNKFFAAVLSIMMILSLIPTTAMANEPEDETVPQEDETVYVAQIGEPAPLADNGLPQADENGVIKLDRDYSVTTLDTSLTYDLNGHTLTCTFPDTVSVGENETLSFIDSSVSGEKRGGKLEITVTNAQGAYAAAINVKAGGTVNVSNIIVDCSCSAFYPQGNAAAVNITYCDVSAGCYCVGTNAGSKDNYGVEITLVGSTFTAKNSDGDNCPVMINVEGTLVIDDCEITGQRQGVIVRAGTATITNSTITTTGEYPKAASQYHSGKWGSGNEVPASALTVGNYVNGAAGSYTDDAIVTLVDTTVEGAESVPAIYVDANQTYKAEVSISGEDTMVTGEVTKGQYAATDAGSDAKQVTIEVTGGTFTDSIQEFIPDGTALTQGENGTVVADAGSVVAEVAGVPYKTLQAAIDAAGNSGTVTLLNDTTENIIIAAGQDIILDLNGCTLSGGNTTVKKAALTNNGIITIKDSSSPSTGMIKREDVNAAGYYVIDNQGTMTIESGSVYNNTGTMPNGSSLIRNAGKSTEATLTISGGDIKQDGFIAVKNDDLGILYVTGGTITTTGDTATNTASAIQNWSQATISGGKINGTVWTSTWSDNFPASKTVIEKDAIVNGKIIIRRDEYTGDKLPMLEITGGMLDVEWLNVENDDYISISGGSFSSRVPEEYCADDYAPATLSNGKYTVTLKNTYPITIIGPTNRAESVININGDTLMIQGKETTLFDPHDNSQAAAQLKNWVYNGWKFTATKPNGTTATYGPTKTIDSGLTAFVKESVANGWGLTMDSAVVGYYLIPSTGSSRDDDDDGYSVSVPGSSSIKNGSITVSPRSAEKGDTVTITVKPDAGYELDTLTVTDSSGKTVKLTEKSGNKYTFIMPASAVRVQVSFTRSGSAAERRFTDVSDSYWAENEITWAAENGYMNGNTATTFNPEGTVTRQQLWMILARLSGYEPADFTEAKAWAVDNAISDGTNPGGAVSRQQLVTILYRYAARMGYKTTGAADLTVYPDHGSVASYAGDAMGWSVANSIVGGTAQGTLNPAGTATRAQFAVILYRFCDKVVG